MSGSEDCVRVAAVGDVHVGDSGALPSFDGVDDAADLLLLAGDLTRTGTRAKGPSLPLSSRTRRSAVFLPIPGTLVRGPAWPLSTSCASSSTRSAPRTVSAILGPIFETLISNRNALFSSGVANPNSSSASSRAWVWIYKVTAPLSSAVPPPGSK